MPGIWTSLHRNGYRCRTSNVEQLVAPVWSLIAALKSACSTKNLAFGKRVHATSEGTQLFASNIYAANTLVSMYAKCSSDMADAQAAFDAIAEQERDVVSWTALVLGYASKGMGRVALDLFQRMQLEGGCEPDARSYTAALMAVTSLARDDVTCKRLWLDIGRDLHVQSVTSGSCGSDVFVASALVDMYAKCGSMTDARAVFDAMPHHDRDVVTWTALILGYVDNGQPAQALHAFAQMHDPSALTFVAALKACGSLGDLHRGMLIHSQVAKTGLDSKDTFVGGSLVDMYVKCGSLADAWETFHKMQHRDVVCWTSIILGYAEAGDCKVAFVLFAWMQLEGCQPDARCFVAALTACSRLAAVEEAQPASAVSDGKHDYLGDGGLKPSTLKLKALERGMGLHSQAWQCGHDGDMFVANALVDLYSKCGSLLDARGTFDRMFHRDVVSWNALLLGCAENEQELLALDLFACMRHEGCKPDARTHVALLVACGNAAISYGREIHAETCRSGLEVEAFVASCLVGFYGKCGSIGNAVRVFETLDSVSLVTWNALMAACSCNCGSKLEQQVTVFTVFERMQAQGVKPDGVTFLCVLTACNHEGLVDKGMACFESMSSKHGLDPAIQHYHCMIDMLGRMNQLHAALDMAKTMPVEKTLDCMEAWACGRSSLKC
ncbi:pentatricopeptide repeat-containing protein At1g11290, chloroplastic-like [Selaginella moellendorffii]|uniref:pentatricopeptide repeat-containing protein At1g11290, chloroplastic-like n=1 Tax=Selaginella moellendorffii TaxID=88036 RepID=UPI000D1C64F0|nr:pentatricopeptide repeat-containing protein At1g11290, chloroplastic-like [Selaginella moellendorffii]|eukprot:XP_024545861.1 pentatricopeptide repeat-containing protein At1g11290, chloroplastic-like [Selaginella moellendorffii]